MYYCISVLLLSLKPIYGLAGSLENLKKEVSNETGYKTELGNYASSHNMSFGTSQGRNITVNDFDVSELEEIVKTHMSYCQKENATQRADARLAYGVDVAISLGSHIILGNC